MFVLSCLLLKRFLSLVVIQWRYIDSVYLPDPYWIRIDWVAWSGSEFWIQIRIQMHNKRFKFEKRFHKQLRIYLFSVLFIRWRIVSEGYLLVCLCFNMAHIHIHEGLVVKFFIYLASNVRVPQYPGFSRGQGVLSVLYLSVFVFYRIISIFWPMCGKIKPSKCS